MIPELNVGYGTTNPQKLLHVVENNVAIRLQDIPMPHRKMMKLPLLVFSSTLLLWEMVGKLKKLSSAVH